jgi:hypothetical protein
MSFWLSLAVGLIAGAGPSLLTASPLRPWVARRWWWLSFGLAIVFLVVPFGLVLIMFLSEAAFDAIREMGDFLWGDDFGWVSRLTLGWLAGSGAMAWVHRHAPRLQGPPPSEEVKALARDPDQLYPAVQRYQQEAGVGVAVATDVLEGYLAAERRRGAIKPRPLEAIEWMYVGFAAAWYGALGLVFVLFLRSAPNPFLTGLAVFVFIPALFGGFCGLCLGAVRGRVKERLQRAWQDGALKQRYALTAGVMAGLVSIAGVLAVGYIAFSWSQSETGVWVAILGVGAVLAASPFLGLWLLLRKCAVAQA